MGLGHGTASTALSTRVIFIGDLLRGVTLRTFAGDCKPASWRARLADVRRVVLWCGPRASDTTMQAASHTRRIEHAHRPPRADDPDARGSHLPDRSRAGTD